MNMLKSLACALTATLCASTVLAAPFNLGVVSVPSSNTLTNTFTSVQNFDDQYTFTIASGANSWGGVFEYVSTDNYLDLLIKSIQLWDFEKQIAATAPTLGGCPVSGCNFAFSGLVAGDYTLHVAGSVEIGGGVTKDPVYYSGVLNLSDISVPEPETLALLGLGLVATGLARRRRVAVQR